MQLTLHELPPYIAKNMPMAKTIKHMVVDETAKAVRFDWQGRHFLVQPSLQVFELKQGRLYATGASVLLYVILATKTTHQTLIGEAVESFDEAIHAIKNNPLKGCEQLVPIKTTLTRLIGKSLRPKKG